MPDRDDAFELYVQELHAREMQMRIDPSAVFGGISNILTDQLLVREVDIDVDPPDPKINIFKHRPKMACVAKFILPNGQEYSKRLLEFPEYIFVSRGYIIDKEVWDSAGLSKRRKIKFELSEILDGVYVYRLDKI